MTDEIDIKLNEYYAGKMMRKDLTKLVKKYTCARNSKWQEAANSKSWMTSHIG